MSISVQFADVLDLVVQSSVKVNGLDAGRVTEIGLADDGWTAEVQLLLIDDITLPANAHASIQQTSLLGEKFVQLTEPETVAPSGRLTSGDVIPLDDTRTATDIEQVLGALSLLLNGGGVQATIQPIVEELRVLAEGREDDIAETLRSADELISGLNRQRDSITQALEGVNELSTRANAQREQIEAALDQLPAGIAVLESQRPQLVEMLQRVDELGEVGSDILLESREDLIRDLRALRPILQELGKVPGSSTWWASCRPSVPGFGDDGHDRQLGERLHLARTSRCPRC